MIFAFFSIGAFAQTPDLAGKWLDVTDTAKGLIMDKEGYFSFIKDGVANGGKIFETQGMQMQMTCVLNTTKSPVWVDIVLTDKTAKTELARMYGLVSVVDANTLDFMINDAERSTAIDKTSGDYVRLKRVKN